MNLMHEDAVLQSSNYQIYEGTIHNFSEDTLLDNFDINLTTHYKGEIHLNNSESEFGYNDTGYYVLGPQLKLTPGEITLFSLFYTMVFILAVFGNSLVIAAVYKNKWMHTVINFFIGNLAVADLLSSIVCIMPTLVTHIYSGWVMGWLMCKLIPFITCAAVVSSISTLTAIAIDRYLAICTTFNCSPYKITKSSAKVIIGVIWLYAALVPIPWAVVYKHTYHPSQNTWVCYEDWESPKGRKVYFMVAIFFLNYLVPLFLISVCYTMITAIVLNRKPPSPTANTSNVIYRSKIKVVKMLSVVVALFALSWLPLYVLHIVLVFELLTEESAPWLATVKYLFPFAQWLTYFNACMNPFIYSFLSNKYRHAFREMIKCLYCKRRHSAIRARVGTYSLAGTNASTSTSGIRVRGKEERVVRNNLIGENNREVYNANHLNVINLTEHVTTV